MRKTMLSVWASKVNKMVGDEKGDWKYQLQNMVVEVAEVMVLVDNWD